MKRIVNILMLWVVVSATTFAQVKFGIKAGANLSKASFSKDVFSSENRMGFLIGPMIDVKIPILGLGIDAAIQYNNKSTTVEDEQKNNEVHTVTLHNIEIPVNAKWTFGNDKIFSVYGATGPQIAWNLNGKSLKNAFDAENYDMTKSLFSWNVGAGVTFLKHVRIGYTYNIAITETAIIYGTDDNGQSMECKLKNNTHQFFLTFFF